MGHAISCSRFSTSPCTCLVNSRPDAPSCDHQRKQAQSRVGDADRAPVRHSIERPPGVGQAAVVTVCAEQEGRVVKDVSGCSPHGSGGARGEWRRPAAPRPGTGGPRPSAWAWESALRLTSAGRNEAIGSGEE